MSDRRHFLATAAAGLALPMLGAEANKTYSTALIGSGWWGMNILREAMASGRCRVVGLCDVDANVLENGIADVESEGGGKPRGYRDYRELLAKEKPQIVIIATPDHWHALQSIAAAQAGAHIYVEKPTGHTIAESQAMLRAARKAAVVVQVGLHRRIGPHHVAAMEFLRSGKVGQVGMVRLFAHSRGGPETPKPNAKAPEGLDWDLWCGPGPLRPFNSKLHPGGWRHFLDYANGTMGDWGVHWMDQVLWWSGQPGPKRVFCSGGRDVAGPVLKSAQESSTDAPDHQIATFEFDGFTAVWEHRKFGANNAEKHQVGAYFYGSNGTLHIGWKDGWTFYPNDPKATPIHGDNQLQEPQGDGHNIALLWTDFLRAIDLAQKPVADIEIGHRSSMMPLLAMISWRCGRSIQWDPQKEEILGDAEASALMRRDYRAPWVYPS